MNTQNDPQAVVIGAGPAGSYTALQLAKRGIKTVVYEEHNQIGLPSHCAGHISIRSLKTLGLYPLEGIVENTFCAANFYSPQGTKFTLHLNCPVTAVLNRTYFDQYLAKQAQNAGAEFILNSRVQSLLIQRGTVTGLKVKTNDTNIHLNTPIVVDTEGVSSRLLRQTGLTPLKTSGLVYAIETEMNNVENVEEHAVEVYFGRNYAPGFYGWIIPKPDGTAKVGLATNQGDPRNYLRRLMIKHPVASKQLSKAKILSANYHAISLGGPIPQACSNGFLAVGDCASQVKPTTGGGVIFSLTAAKEAANTASQALTMGDVSVETLITYQKRCTELFSFDFKTMLQLRHFLDSLSDEKLDEMLRVCSKLGVDKALSGVTEIDFQGKMLLSVATKPAMIAALVYFGLLYLHHS
ncbi:MAG: NAD(P)/FAD-dependent oxidoreductase [Nitrososphaerota archaeon]|jgi:geranylgeranyl reductase family protein|uniref:NAD(P)/FAD-dependent oxidoreductase n=1 Tax=Candidatus Bathycorpusculum sp. TaxID=2994959 RepID=UPI00283003D3|nr:NAD(P)/FAD-dependent oxidoreductase [Candidatus Termitimicrobium sp.]MCL2431178.1 NAD(P)/FAD-dependent oxidoreductase [Candidatus Termitimicrobium sp.]MDR0492304.1 NAD(P)/FAD-dependent oxidoreductase [Nitrososphaerota archaeon]